MSQTQELDRKDLKVQALLEKISNMTAQYENQVADLRVELTIKEHEAQQASARLAELETPDVPEEEKKKPSK